MPQLTLEERVDRLESIDAIKRLKAVYCMYCDAKYDAEGICSLFIEDGVWDGGPSFGRYEGHQQIRSFFERISGDILFSPCAQPHYHCRGRSRSRQMVAAHAMYGPQRRRYSRRTLAIVRV